jgi:hypothetical protein
LKIIEKPVEVVAWYTKEGIMNPIRFRIIDDEETKVIKINKILKRDRYKIEGKEVVILRCRSEIGGIQKNFELKFEIASCIWKLYKI